MIVLVFLFTTTSCDDDKSLSMTYSYMQNGLQVLDYSVIQTGKELSVSYTVLLTETVNTEKDGFVLKQISREGSFSFGIPNNIEPQKLFRISMKTEVQKSEYDYVNEFVVVCDGQRNTIRIKNEDDVFSEPPPSYLKDVSELLEFHRLVLEKIGNELDMDKDSFCDAMFKKSISTTECVP